MELAFKQQRAKLPPTVYLIETLLLYEYNIGKAMRN